MYIPHPNPDLNALFALKPWQGVAPAQATFLFIGLDANYAPQIAAGPIMAKVLDYHRDGVVFWRAHGVHHPFLLPEYSGDGRYYHRSFARIGFTPAHAHLVSFAELLHVPTVGRNKLAVPDLSAAHLKMLSDAILHGSARHIFIPSTVARFMRETGHFPWLPKAPIDKAGPLGVLYRAGGKTVYSHLHFSNYGKFLKQKEAEAVAIRGLLP